MTMGKHDSGMLGFGFTSQRLGFPVVGLSRLKSTLSKERGSSLKAKIGGAARVVEVLGKLNQAHHILGLGQQNPLQILSTGGNGVLGVFLNLRV